VVGIQLGARCTGGHCGLDLGPDPRLELPKETVKELKVAEWTWEA